MGYHYSTKLHTPHPDQQKILEFLIRKGRKTSFGKIYNFSSLIGEEQTELSTAFSQQIPIFSYERFYQEFLKFQLNGSKNVTWPGEVEHYALTSGTTQGGSKKIPVSVNMIKQFQKTTLQQIVALHELDLPPSFFKTSILTIGGSTRLERVDGHLEGDLSGILQRNKAIVYKLFTKPGSRISAIKNWHTKTAAIVKSAKKWDVGVIAGSPVWVTKILEEIVKYYNVNNIHDIWPNLKLFLHGGVYLDTYEEAINKYCAHPIMFLDTYLTSEGYFAYQKHPQDDGMQLLVNHGVYYEFVEEKYFDLLTRNNQLEKIPTLTLGDVKKGERYALVVSTSAGLWRYCLGDVVRFTSTSPYLIKIDGRVKHTLNMVGEHVSLENMNNAIQRTNDIFKISSEEYCVVQSSEKQYHHWYIGSNQVVHDQEKYAAILDGHLEEVNDDYKSVRKHCLGKPKVTFLPLEKFYEYLEYHGKIGAQYKFPRVLNIDQASDWEAFLSRLD